MKSTGIIRKLDELGRIVLPIEIRRTFALGEKDAVEIFVEGDSIILKKYQPNCIICGGDKGLIEYKGKLVCKSCTNSLSKRV
ncbi:MAG: AbrB/MazE/SpoVT family DNA-binding domain-containing protein [Oscillospiraceae bacterium]|nr:AbrB/MazE/SpoVT family DNA-binding domain-containing protein [Oscillospiraceae bacterium]